MRPAGDEALIAALSPLSKVGLTLYGEGRGCEDAELHGIASAILNRVKAHRFHAFGLSAEDVCLKPAQFSCWSPIEGEKNYHTLIGAARVLLNGGAIGTDLRRCLGLAVPVCDGTLPDTVGHSTHYVTEALLTQAPPAWARGRTPTVVINNTAFFAGIA